MAKKSVRVEELTAVEVYTSKDEDLIKAFMHQKRVELEGKAKAANYTVTPVTFTILVQQLWLKKTRV